ncbi:hypothetical protein LPY66_10595 [Dehalobacter sp. DCM]|uniref:hypothetical protein n=1 Tax=Dehalobacter sp. DCM TaxID=2907827 RepID=UPI00308150C6|nr:hypothetical protein LPY66_10595 [Dehalobacter sp. DCM]
MRYKILLVLALCTILFISLTVSSLSSYTTVSNFGISIIPDKSRLQESAVKQ